MDNELISSFIIGILVFFGTLSFAITSFGGDILFQLGISICSLSGTFCKGSLLTTLAMITLMAFIKLPIQLLLLRKYINTGLALRLGIPMCVGTVIGLRLLTHLSNDLLLKRIFGYIILIISLYHLVNDIIADYRDNKSNKLTQNTNVENAIHNNEDGNHQLYNSIKNDLQERNYNLEVDRFQINTRKKEITICFAGFLAGLLAGMYGTGLVLLLYQYIFITFYNNCCRRTTIDGFSNAYFNP